MVDPPSSHSVFFKRVGAILRRGAVHPRSHGIVRIALAALFIYAGVVKLFDPRAFAATISTYDLVPETLLPLVAVGLPLVEAAAGVALMLNRSWGLHLITGLLGLFVCVLGYGIIGDLDVDCGCFGTSELEKQAGLRLAFYRDLLLVGAVVPYLYLCRRVRKYARSKAKEE
ncbi:MAG: DoxX family membrane protein [Deltaproteobacteria bacterium]|nr:DoxX family membrane protein [Deltaproteobacteria bacterium]